MVEIINLNTIQYLLTFIITLILILILRKFYINFLESNKNKSNKLDDNINKNNLNNKLNKENIKNFYNHDNKLAQRSDHNNRIAKSTLTLKQSKNKNLEENTSFKSYDDKIIYNYLYKLPPIKNRLVIIDTEVAGISSLDHIIELCALEMINGKLTSKYYHSFFNPKKRINNSILRKHKIPTKVFKYTYEQEKKIFQEFLKFVNNSIIIAHNAVFDMEKINYELNFYNLPLIDKNQFRCSMRIFLDKYTYFSNKFSKLNECCNFFRIKYDENNLHLAYYDAFLAGKIMEKIYENEYNKEEIKNIKQKDTLNNNFIKQNKNNKINNEIKNIDISHSIKAKSDDKDSFEKFVGENIENIYKEIEAQETDKLVENILNEEEEKCNNFNKFVNENIDDIFQLLDKEEKKG